MDSPPLSRYSTEEDIETFYGQLEHIIEELPNKDVKIVMGDWNAKMGTDNVGWEQVIGRYAAMESVLTEGSGYWNLHTRMIY